MSRLGEKIIMLDSTTSTNTYAAALVAEGNAGHGTVVATGFQTAGRGQAGNKWESQRGMNLTFSIILYPQKLAASDQFLISMVVSLGIADALARHLKNISIKWPNDIYAGGDKIAGILIEHAITGSSIAHTIAGIGINVNQVKFPDDIPNPVSMKQITGEEYDTGTVLKEILASVGDNWDDLMAGNRTQIGLRYNNILYRKESWHLYRAGEEVFEGMITGTDESGALNITVADGRKRTFLFREIEYIL